MLIWAQRPFSHECHVYKTEHEIKSQWCAEVKASSGALSSCLPLAEPAVREVAFQKGTKTLAKPLFVRSRVLKEKHTAAP